MPELPEVEVTRRRIEPLLVERRISAVRTSPDSYFFLTPPRELRRRLRGRVILQISRHGKYLVASLDDGCRLLIHLGMTGQLFASGAESVRLLSATARAALAPDEQARFEPDSHTHLRLEFDDGGPEVYMRDVRKFGKLMLLDSGESHPRLDRLGKDALEFAGAELFDASRKRKTSIKALLLDQSTVAGVGNIYADESLFLAGVRPGRRASRVTRAESERIVEALGHVLRRSIESGGSSISDYVAPDGSDGRYQDERKVYAREGDACYSCGAAIRKKVIAQRGTHYCPQCQR
jgi:formamidopyrimidine-DNA glycosylase